MRLSSVYVFIVLTICCTPGCASFSKGQPVDIPIVDTQLTTYKDKQEILELIEQSSLWDRAVSDGYYSRKSDGYYSRKNDDSDDLEEVLVTGSRIPAPAQPSTGEEESITNNQEMGVDEGDIVKRVGDYLVLLRRGRLFSFSLPIRGRSLEAISYTDIAPDDQLDAWYDEILSYRNQIILIGFSYQLDASIIQRYSIGEDGNFVDGKTYAIQSEDYFDPDNYSVRLVNGKLVFSFAIDLEPENLDLKVMEIADGKFTEGSSLFERQTIYRPIIENSYRWSYQLLHTIAQCPLDQQDLKCSATTVIGPSSKLGYTSERATYLWLEGDFFVRATSDFSNRKIRRLGRAYGAYKRYLYDSDQRKESEPISVLYRIPLNDEPVKIVLASGEPVSRFSFRESDDGLQILTEKSIDSGEKDIHETYLLSVPESAFSEFGEPLDPSNYRLIGSTSGSIYRNRFIGDYILYIGEKPEDDRDDQPWLFAHDLESNESESFTANFEWQLDHWASRIEAIGDNAIVIGSDGHAALGFSSWNFSGSPRKGNTTWLYRAFEADERSHSFNYKIQSDQSLFAFPVSYVPESEIYYHYWEDYAIPVSTAFFRFDRDLSMTEIGELSYQPKTEDNCIVSCTDWYGNSRPFFIGNKLYALMGYEIVEAEIRHGALLETGRANGLELLKAK